MKSKIAFLLISCILALIIIFVPVFPIIFDNELADMIVKVFCTVIGIIVIYDAVKFSYSFKD
jgi:hypothetical protein